MILVVVIHGFGGFSGCDGFGGCDFFHGFGGFGGFHGFGGLVVLMVLVGMGNVYYAGNTHPA